MKTCPECNYLIDPEKSDPSLHKDGCSMGNKESLREMGRLEAIKRGYEVYQRDDGSYFYTDPNYWDCECTDKFIHLKTRLKKCGRCGTRHDEQPDSRVHEIKNLYDINEGWC